MPTRPAVTLLPMLLALAAATAAAQGGIPAAHIVRGTLSFDGHASLGDFTGATDSLRGAMTGGDGLAAVRGWVEASVATLRTGNGRRDKDLRSSMEVQTYPTMRFDLDSVQPGATTGGGDTTAVMLSGRLTIHGVTREVNVPAAVVVDDRVFGGMEIRLRSTFPLNLTDYRIGGLSKMLGVLKMHEGIEVHVDVVFAPTR